MALPIISNAVGRAHGDVDGGSCAIYFTRYTTAFETHASLLWVNHCPAAHHFTSTFISAGFLVRSIVVQGSRLQPASTT